jgi:glycogen synthase
MAREYSQQRRRAFVLALQEIDRFWGQVVGDETYYDLHYSDLFTRMWLHGERRFKKTDLYDFMPRVSHRTAVKYVQRAIVEGLLVEAPDENDRRAKQVSLSSDLKERIERFLDHGVETLEEGPLSAAER